MKGWMRQMSDVSGFQVFRCGGTCEAVGQMDVTTGKWLNDQCNENLGRYFYNGCSQPGGKSVRCPDALLHGEEEFYCWTADMANQALQAEIDWIDSRMGGEP